MELEPNKKKTVSFEIELTGANPSTLKGFLRLSLNGIEYGIPAKITNKTILIDIPILKDIIGKNVEYQKKIEGKLEIFHGENYIVPWRGEFTVKSPLAIQIKTKEKSEVRIKTESPAVEKKDVEEVKEVKKRENVDSKVTEGMIVNYIKKQGSKDEKIIQTIIEQCKTKAKGDFPVDTLREVIKFFQENKKRYST